MLWTGGAGELQSKRAKEEEEKSMGSNTIRTIVYYIRNTLLDTLVLVIYNSMDERCVCQSSPRANIVFRRTCLQGRIGDYEQW